MGCRSPNWLLGKEAGQQEGAAGTGATPPSGRRCSCRHHCHRSDRTRAARSSGALAEVSPPGAGGGGGQQARPLACWGGGGPSSGPLWLVVSSFLMSCPQTSTPERSARLWEGGRGLEGWVPILQLSVPLQLLQER